MEVVVVEVVVVAFFVLPFDALFSCYCHICCCNLSKYIYVVAFIVGYTLTLLQNHPHTAEVGIYNGKQESKKTRKQKLDQESDQEKRFFFLFFLSLSWSSSCFLYFFLFSWSLSWLSSFFLSFFLVFDHL